jgi:hypothetical protein
MGGIEAIGTPDVDRTMDMIRRPLPTEYNQSVLYL